MKDLLLHPTTAHQLEALRKSAPHAVLIAGNSGTGKQTVALELATELLQAKSAEHNPQILQIFPENNSIGVETIRNIRDFLSRKTTGTNEIRRAILVIDAHSMTTEAQNALLKTLEEPPADTVLILTADNLTALKPTIRSRSQQLLVLPVSQKSAVEYFSKLDHSTSPIESAFTMSGGSAGLMCALLENKKDHELVGAIAQAKRIIKMPVYERLLETDALSKQKDTLPLLLAGLELVVLSGLRMSANKQNSEQTKRFYELSKKVERAQKSLQASANSKLMLDDLFLQM